MPQTGANRRELHAVEVVSERWQRFCCVVTAIGHCCVDRAKMGQAMRSQRQFCLDLLPGEFAARQPSDDQDKRFAQDRSVGQRLDRLRRVGIESARQRALQIEAMIADFEKMANALEADVRSEEDRTRIHDPAHYAYSTFARAMTQRCGNLKRSIGELQRQLAEAKRTAGSTVSGASGPPMVIEQA